MIVAAKVYVFTIPQSDVGSLAVCFLYVLRFGASSCRQVQFQGEEGIDAGGVAKDTRGARLELGER